jgi:hypothetical protein
MTEIVSGAATATEDPEGPVVTPKVEQSSPAPAPRSKNGSARDDAALGTHEPMAGARLSRRLRAKAARGGERFPLAGERLGSHLFREFPKAEVKFWISGKYIKN